MQLPQNQATPVWVWSAVASVHVTSVLCTAAGKLRSADCVAEGRVQVVVINKKDFMDLDNPLLAWMLDSDAVTTVLRVSASPPLSQWPLIDAVNIWCAGL